MSEVSETLRIMAANIDATRPEHDYSLAHKRVDDSDIDALIRAADEIERLTAERDEARREVCQWEHHWDKTSSEQYYADKRGWDCFREDKPCQ